MDPFAQVSGESALDMFASFSMTRSKPSRSATTASSSSTGIAKDDTAVDSYAAVTSSALGIFDSYITPRLTNAKVTSSIAVAETMVGDPFDIRVSGSALGMLDTLQHRAARNSPNASSITNKRDAAANSSTNGSNNSKEVKPAPSSSAAATGAVSISALGMQAVAGVSLDDAATAEQMTELVYVDLADVQGYFRGDDKTSKRDDDASINANSIIQSPPSSSVSSSSIVVETRVVESVSISSGNPFHELQVQVTIQIDRHVVAVVSIEDEPPTDLSTAHEQAQEHEHESRSPSKPVGVLLVPFRSAVAADDDIPSDESAVLDSRECERRAIKDHVLHTANPQHQHQQKQHTPSKAKGKHSVFSLFHLDDSAHSKPSTSSSSSHAQGGKSLEQRLRDFYSEYNPAKLPEVQSILIKYQGREKELINKLQKQYNTRLL
jgi:hypothetical protein